MYGTEIYDLKVCSLKEPCGLDTTPTFSWKMRSDVVGQKQSAYMISVIQKKDGKMVWNSGKVESSQSNYIPCNAVLQPATTYVWSVTVWDKDEKRIAPQSSCFTTGLLNSGWDNAKWLTIHSDSDMYAGIREYTVESSFVITRKEISYLIGTGSHDQYYRFTFLFRKEGLFLRPYMFDIIYDLKLCDMGEINLTELLHVKEHDRNTREFTVKFDVSPTKIVICVDGVNVCDLDITEEMANPLLGAPGVHVPGPGGNCIIMGRTVTREKATDRVLYEYDFEKESPFACGTIKNGKWIGNATGTIFPKAPSFILRKEIFCKKYPVDAKLFVSGLGVFSTYINGEKAYNLLSGGEKLYYELTPGNTEGPKRRQYYSYDLTDRIQKGKNALSAIVTSGWWSDMVNTSYGVQNGFLAKLVVEYEDGEREVFVTDETWKTHADSCPVGYCSIFWGEEYDATKSLEFIERDYNDSNWNTVKISREFNGEITSGLKAAVYNRTDMEHQPQSVVVFDGASNADEDSYGTINIVRTYDFKGRDTKFSLVPGETAVVDFGYNCSGREAFTVTAKAGTKITVRHGEALNDCNGLKSRFNSDPEGSVWLGNLLDTAPSATHYICCEGEQTYTPTFTFYGFRYAQIYADGPVTFERLTYQVLTSVKNDSGVIVTANEKVNSLIGNMRRGLLSNYLSVPTDCPQRAERVGWTADTQVFTTSAAYFTTDTKHFLEKWLLDLRDCQKVDGQYVNGCPRGRCGGSSGTFGWADAGVFVPYYLYRMYGDKNVIYDCYESMQKYVDGYLATTDKKGGNIRYGDWLNPSGNDEAMRFQLGVVYYAWVARYMAEMADEIGKYEDAQRYRELYETEKDYFHENYVNSDGTLKFMTQTTVLAALHMDLIDDQEQVKMLINYLAESARSADYKVQTGFLGTAMVLPILSRFGMNDIAYKMLLCTENPSWLYPLSQGATTIWERWDAYTKERGFAKEDVSLNHYSFGAVAEWLYANAAGIRPQKNFEKFIVAPEPNKLLGALSAEYESQNGRIVSAWKYDGSTIVFEIEIPANTTATIQLPCSDKDIVSVNCASLACEKNISNLLCEDSIISFTADSGKYVIVAKA